MTPAQRKLYKKFLAERREQYKQWKAGGKKRGLFGDFLARLFGSKG